MTKLSNGKAAQPLALAHELNNPLTIILGCCHVALESLPDGHPAATYLRAIERAANRCKKLVRSLR